MSTVAPPAVLSELEEATKASMRYRMDLREDGEVVHTWFFHSPEGAQYAVDDARRLYPDTTGELVWVDTQWVGP